MPLYNGDQESPIEELRDQEKDLVASIDQGRDRLHTAQKENELHMAHRKPHQTISAEDREVCNGLVTVFDSVMEGVEEAPVGCLEQVMYAHAGATFSGALMVHPHPDRLCGVAKRSEIR
jgi:hypothetical protein